MQNLRSIAVVGGGHAGLEAVRTIRRSGFDGHLVVVGAEPHPPYDRPAVSKEILIGSRTLKESHLDLGDGADAEWLTGVTATRLEASTRTLTIDGATAAFDGVVVATGAEPVMPRAFTGMDGVHALRTVDDALALKDELARTPEVVVVGGGLIGCEVATACRASGIPVTLVEAEPGVLWRAVGPVASGFLTERARRLGVRLRLGRMVVALRGSDRVAEVVLDGGDAVPADIVVVAVGARPRTAWLAGSGLHVDDGVVCDQTCLAAPGIVAAGDVARWWSTRHGRLVRVEHWDNAVRQGRHAARRLLSDSTGPFDPVPWFWSDQLGGKLQVIGSTDVAEECVRFTAPDEEDAFVALFRHGPAAVAAVTFGASRAMVAARQLINRGAAWSEATSAIQDLMTVEGTD